MILFQHLICLVKLKYFREDYFLFHLEPLLSDNMNQPYKETYFNSFFFLFKNHNFPPKEQQRKANFDT